MSERRSVLDVIHEIALKNKWPWDKAADRFWDEVKFGARDYKADGTTALLDVECDGGMHWTGLPTCGCTFHFPPVSTREGCLAGCLKHPDHHIAPTQCMTPRGNP